MNGYLPHPYPEELFYSIIARSLTHQGVSLGVAAKLVFKKKKFSFHTLLARGINRLLDVNGACMEAEEMIRNHTNFNLLSPFLPQEHCKKVLNAMLAEDVPTVRFEHDFTSTQKNTLSYCPVCCKEDHEYYGEPYWHRIHQLSTILICPYHCCYLRPHRVEDLERKKELYALKLSFCNVNEVRFCEDKKLIDLTRYLYKILTDAKFRNSLDTYYTEFLKLKGFAKGSRVNLEKLTPAFIGYYGEQFLFDELQLPTFKNRAFNWLAQLTRASKFVTSPTMHALLWCFLENTMDDENKSKAPRKKEETHSEVEIGFSKPFKCINRAASHFGQNVVDNYEGYINKYNNTRVEKFKCSCGMVFIRSSLSNNVKGKLARTIVVQQLGEVLEREVLHMVKQGYSFHSVAKFFGISPTIVRRLCKEQNLTESFTRAAKGKRRYINNKWIELNEDEEYAKRTAIWLKLLADNPHARILELIDKEPTTYKWLYTHKREFIRNASKEFMSNKKRLRSEFVKNRTIDLKIFLEEYKEKMIADKYASRITVNRIKTYLSQSGADFLRDTNVYIRRAIISSLAETDEQYKIRLNEMYTLEE